MNDLAHYAVTFTYKCAACGVEIVEEENWDRVVNNATTVEQWIGSHKATGWHICKAASHAGQVGNLDFVKGTWEKLLMVDHGSAVVG